METFFIILIAMLVLMAVASVGVVLGRKPVTGSCGGMEALGMAVSCDICGGDKSKCENNKSEKAPEESSDQTLFYDAAKNHKSNN